MSLDDRFSLHEARCFDCHYPLRGLTDHRCPECGRAFDPDDLKTMNFGRRIGPLRRAMLRPMGWPIVVLACVSAFLAAAATGTGIQFAGMSFKDVPYFISTEVWHNGGLIGLSDHAYAIALWGTIIAIVSWFLRRVMRVIAGDGREFGPQFKPPQHRRRQVSFLIATLATTLIVASGWRVRAARHWVADELANPGSFPPEYLECRDDYGAVLRSGLAHSQSLHETRALLKILLERMPEPGLTTAILTEMLDQPASPELRELEMHLASLTRNRDLVPRIMGYFKDPSSAVRASAIDAIGIIHQPMARVPGSPPFYEHPHSAVDSDPLIAATTFPVSDAWTNDDRRLIEIPLKKEIRDAIEEVMLRGPTVAEREAAARALVCWPPEDYRLRVAEWGVWVDAGSGLHSLRISERNDADIPPFVHRPQDPISSILSRFTTRGTSSSGRTRWTPWSPFDTKVLVRKPVIHVYPNRPMAMDVSILIRMGRPWFAYPMPDDFVVLPTSPPGISYLGLRPNGGVYPTATTEPFVPMLKSLDRPNPQSDGSFHEGYPWVLPHHREFEAGSTYRTYDDIESVGLRWQSVVALPPSSEPASPPAGVVGDQFGWWKRLRDVPAGWLTSRGESERFLYYDGPSLQTPMVSVSSGIGTLKFNVAPEPTEMLDWDARAAFGTTSTQSIVRPPPLQSIEGAEAFLNYIRRIGMWVNVEEGKIEAHIVSMPDDASKDVTLAQLPIITGAEVVPQFRGLLTHAGLTPQEADGLIFSWQKEFFETPGSRFIMLMSGRDYDTLCPIQIRPEPTELVRVGIVLTEFKKSPAGATARKFEVGNPKL